MRRHVRILIHQHVKQWHKSERTFALIWQSQKRPVLNSAIYVVRINMIPFWREALCLYLLFIREFQLWVLTRNFFFSVISTILHLWKAQGDLERSIKDRNLTRRDLFFLYRKSCILNLLLDAVSIWSIYTHKIGKCRKWRLIFVSSLFFCFYFIPNEIQVLTKIHHARWPLPGFINTISAAW